MVRTSTRQTIFLPVPGLVDPTTLKPSDMVGTNKDSYLILEKLPAEFDSRVQAMEVDERPTEEYSGAYDVYHMTLIIHGAAFSHSYVLLPTAFCYHAMHAPQT